MEALFTSGHAVDLVLTVMLVEALLLIFVKKRRPLTVVLTILPGAAMMLALRAALTGAGWQMVAIWLTVSLPLHLADLRHRRLI
jgi:hypothetical protein